MTKEQRWQAAIEHAGKRYSCTENQIRGAVKFAECMVNRGASRAYAFRRAQKLLRTWGTKPTNEQLAKAVPSLVVMV